ncbi:MAG: shikimate dehydrogenase [Coriobacteriaceae bacterium]|nr:shikimate dehydrogenase [Coriobacteriaceae bacterium]
MSPSISGRTQLAGIIGWPLEHTLSPAMHNAAYAAMGLDWVYVPLPVEQETDIYRFFGAVKVLPFVGLNVTMPFKQAMLGLCDEVATFAQMAGAVNTVHVSDGRVIGYNTDGRGLLEALQTDAQFAPEGRAVALVGAGGAAGAALVALVLGKAAKVTVVNRSPERAVQLVGRVSPNARATELGAVELGSAEAEQAVRAADLVVNATSLGMQTGDGSPVPVEWLKGGQVVCDMVYRATPTPLLQGAEAAGAVTVDGLGMLVAQGATAIDIWTEGMQSRAPRDVMRAAAEAALKDGGGETGVTG